MKQTLLVVQENAAGDVEIIDTGRGRLESHAIARPRGRPPKTERDMALCLYCKVAELRNGDKLKRAREEAAKAFFLEGERGVRKITNREKYKHPFKLGNVAAILIVNGTGKSEGKWWVFAPTRAARIVAEDGPGFELDGPCWFITSDEYREARFSHLRGEVPREEGAIIPA